MKRTALTIAIQSNLPSLKSASFSRTFCEMPKGITPMAVDLTFVSRSSSAVSFSSRSVSESGASAACFFLAFWKFSNVTSLYNKHKAKASSPP